MKKLLLGLVAVLLSTSAFAQTRGLPIATPATAPAAGATTLSGGVALNDDFNIYGGALSFAPFQRLSLFGQLGVLDPDHGDLGYAAQGGFQFALPLTESAVDVAIRSAWGRHAYDSNSGDVSENSFNLGAIISRDIDIISPYVFLGLNLSTREVKHDGSKHTKDETDPAAAVGLNVRLGNAFSLYAELAHVDDTFINIGLTRRF